MLCRRRPAILRHPGQEGTAKSPSTATMPNVPWPGRWRPGCTCPGTGPKTCPDVPNPCARGGLLPDQAADRLGPARPSQGLGCVLGLRDRGRRLRRQPQLPDGLEKRRKHYVLASAPLHRGPVAARRADATGRCPGGGGAVVALGDLAGGEPAGCAGGLSRCVAGA